jgi:hypothetical protein
MWWGWVVPEKERQQRAVSAIRAAGGVVQYNWETQGALVTETGVQKLKRALPNLKTLR